MHETTFQSERLLLRIGSITFLTGLAIFTISTAFHASKEDPTNHLRVFAEYANSPTWIAAHIGQFVGEIIIFAGGVCSSIPIACTVRIYDSFCTCLDWIFYSNYSSKYTCDSSGCRWDST